jgi:predicted dehydrogenase/nucleoside-diphosphate-sugar epimerase
MENETLDAKRGLKIGVVGCGNIATTQLKYITRFIGRERIALCDLNPIRRAFLAQQYQIPRTFGDLGTLLEEFRPEVVHILSPPHTHRDIALRCLEHGCHLFIEKPMCVTVTEAQEIVAAARRRNVLVCVDHLRVTDPLILRVKELLASGAWGQVVHVALSEADNYLERKRAGLAPKWLTDLPGEIIWDLLPHHLSILGEFLPELKVSGVTARTNCYGELIALTCLLSSPQGSGTIHLSLESQLLKNEAAISCTRGALTVNFRDLLLIRQQPGTLPGPAERVWSHVRTSGQALGGNLANIYRFLRGRLDAYAGMERLLADFYQAIQTHGVAPVPAETGGSVMALVHDIFQRIALPEKKGLLAAPRVIVSPKTDRKAALVTGGTGFIGRVLVKRLVGAGWRVRLLTHRELTMEEADRFEKEVEIFQGDVANPPDVARACAGVQQLYHLAAATKGNWLNHLDATVAGTQHVVEAALTAGVHRLIYVSTIGLLNATHYPDQGEIDESFPYEEHPEKRGSYAYAKLLAEKLVLEKAAQAPDLKVIILRPGLVYGPGKNPLSDVVQRVSRRLRVSLKASKRVLPLVYVDNLVDALMLAGETEATGIFNVVDQEIVSVKDFIRAYKGVTGERFVTFYLPRGWIRPVFGTLEKVLTMLQGQAPHMVYKLRAASASARHSTARLEQTLGWRSAVPFRDALKTTMEGGLR